MNKYIIALLIVFNLLLIYRVYDIEKNLANCTLTLNNKNEIQYSTPDIKIKNKIELYVYIYETGCLSCNMKVIEYVNKLKEKYPDKLKLKYYGANEFFLREIGYEYEFSKVDYVPLYYGYENNNYYPINVLIDKNNYIQKYLLVTPDNYLNLDVFYKSIESLFQITKKEYK